MRGRNEAKGDSRWGQIEEKGFDTLSRYGFREWEHHAAYWESPCWDSCGRGSQANQEGWIKIHFQKASRWHFLFASFSLGLCLCNALRRTWGHEETGWNRLNVASLFFFFFWLDSSISSFITIWTSRHFSSYTFICLPTVSIFKVVDCF